MAMDPNNNLYFDLSHFGLIAVSGAEAETFLQNQLSSDLKDLEKYGWLLSAWCLPNGRVLSNFILYQKGESYHLILPSMLKEKIMQRLTMYVLRSDVKITDISDDYAVFGLYGLNTENIIDQVNDNIEERGQRLLQGEHHSIIKIWGDIPRLMLTISMEKLKLFMNRMLMGYKESDRRTWSLLDIESGLPWIIPATSETFLPQMLNLDITGGLSFQKGCYPGQEVIARLHYRGELKKRLFIGTGTSAVSPGPNDQLEDMETGKLLGEVLDAEPCDDEQFKLLAVAEIKDNKTYQAKLRGSEETIVELEAVKTSNSNA